jgi:ribonuclease Z
MCKNKALNSQASCDDRFKANVKQLILGHYSTRYGGLEGFKTEASTIFKDVLLADDGKVFEF